jgi:ABC-type Fe3+/spermidine/putrescine transport system ATPase subunit
MASVELERVHKAYGTTQVVRGVSMSVQSGELIALLGPSGCGKTTTLRMVAGLERLDRGVIRVDGREVDGPGVTVPPERRGLGMVFQSYAVWPNRTVAENVAYPLRLQRVGRSEREARVREALGWVRLTTLGDRLPQQLSGGQLQRVAIARALVATPRVLLLDEPLSNLDAALREELRGEIAALRARLGTTMLFVTHDQGEALALADRVALMNHGVIEQLDRPDVVYREPATPYVATFVGGANALEGRVEGGSFIVGELRFSLPAEARGVDGPTTLVVRPEDVQLGGDGPTLPLSARLFLGSATEYRFVLGERVLRVVGAPRDGAVPGTSLAVRFGRVRLYPRAP